MKATIVEQSNNNVNVLSGIRSTDSKIHKPKHHNKEEENEEIKAYLTKLQEIVPFMPKHKKLSKLEVITYVIDYIRDLRTTLGLPPSVINDSRVPPIPGMDFDLMDEAELDLFSSNSNSSSFLIDNNNVSSINLHHHSLSSSTNRTPLSQISTPNNTSLSSPFSTSSSCGSHPQEVLLISEQINNSSSNSSNNTKPSSSEVDVVGSL